MQPARRRLIAFLLGAPCAAFAQKPPLPVIGFLSSRTPEQGRYLIDAIRRGLKEAGYVEGENVAIEYRWAKGRVEDLPALAAELTQRPVALIIAGGTAPPAQAATNTIPIVFTTGLDPVAYGLVTNLSQPRGNLTGASFYSGALGGKQLELLQEMAPKARSFALLVKADSPSAHLQVVDTQRAAQTRGISLEVLNAKSAAELESAFAALSKRPAPALIVSVDPYFDSRARQLVSLAARYAIPTVYTLREFVQAGGLISYGASITDTYRQAGVYAGRILKGAKPADLPVLLPTRFELVINAGTARSLGLSVPQSLALRADEIL